MMRRLSGAFLAALVLRLVAVPALPAKPPDLPDNPRIVVSQPACEDEPEAGPADTPDAPSLHRVFLFLGADPLMRCLGGEDVVAQDEPAGKNEPAAREPEAAPACPPGVCPFPMGPAHGVTVAAVVKTPALESLQQAAKLLLEAKELQEAGRCWAALEKLGQVCRLCPEARDRVERASREVLGSARGPVVAVEWCEEESLACGCCCGGVGQFGLCWMSRLADWWNALVAASEKEPKECPIHMESPAMGSQAGGGVEVMLLKPMTAAFEGMSVQDALFAVRDTMGVPIVIDQESVTKVGVGPLDGIPAMVHAPQMPVRLVLGMLLAPLGLVAEVKGCVVIVGAATHAAPAPAPEPEGCGSACPKCEKLHAECVRRRRGVAEQVNGLMKACYLAVGAGRFDKAADLARQAYSLDPASVQGDPLIYKMHLLAEKAAKGKAAEVRPFDTGLLVAPALPEVFQDVPPALDAVLTGKDKRPEQP